MSITPKKKILCDCQQPGCPHCDPNGLIEKYHNLSLKNMIEKSSKKLIESLQKERKKLWEEMEASYNEESNQYAVNHSRKIDDFAEKIMSNLKELFDDLQFDFIFEMLTHLGHAPCLLYDDNGFFAVTSDGMNSVSYGDEPLDMEFHHFVEAKQFQKTPKEALHFYLFDE